MLISAKPTPKVSVPIVVNAIETVLKFPPLFQAAKRKAREKIIAKGENIGLRWYEERAKLEASIDWDKQTKILENPNLLYPSYYTKPFHAYDEGNLCFEAALEVDLASVCVHADVMDPQRKMLQRNGDAELRRNYHRCLNEILEKLKIQTFQSPCKILDVGCSSGLSSRALLKVFPEASVTGIDLSPYFLAVGEYLHQQRVESGKTENLTFVHGAVEDNAFENNSFDMVSICLVFHEMPQSAILNTLQSAWRVLRPGGVLSIMEIDPTSPRFSNLFKNPFALAGFKSTEPWLLEYISFDLEQEIEKIGFKSVTKKSNSPGHKTVVAIKP